MLDNNTALSTRRDISEIAEDSMKRYAAKVILDRAIPDVRDGFKPVQRRMMYTLNQQKLTPTARFVKVSTIAGLNMAYYHPHGQADGVLIDLSEQWSKRLPLVETHGNNGGIDGSPAAAGRYVSARQTKAAALFLNGLDKNAVKMVDAYHDGMKEPTVLPSAIPAALVNGASGIALGMRTDILPHNPIELLLAAKLMILKPEISSEEISQIVQGPDFPTGGLMIATKDQIIEDIETGSTSFTVRGTVEIVDDKKEPKLVITSIPWNVNTSKLIEQIASVAESTRIVQVEQIVNGVESHEDLSISIEFEKNTSVERIEKFEALLYKKTDLEKKFRSHNLLIVNGKPKVIGVKENLKIFIDFRLETLRNIWKFEKEKFEDRLELVSGLYRLAKGFPILDVMKAIDGRGRQAVIDELVDIHEFTVRQAEYIADMSVYRLKDSQDKLDAVEKEYNDLNKSISDRDKYLSDAEASKLQLIADIENSIEVLKDYVRLTKVVDQVKEVKIEKMIESVESKPCVVIAKRDLQACQIGPRAFDNQKDSADLSQVADTLKCNTDDFVVLLTKKGRAITRRAADLDTGNFTSTHQSFNKAISTVTADDEIISVVKAEENSGVKLVTVSNRGYVKVIDPIKLRLNVNNKGYLKRSGQFSSVKNGEDEIAYVFKLSVAKDGRFVNDMIEFELTHQSREGKTVKVELDLRKIESREDGAGGNGAKHVNTWDGTRKFLKAEVKDYEIEETEQLSEDAD